MARCRVGPASARWRLSPRAGQDRNPILSALGPRRVRAQLRSSPLLRQSWAATRSLLEDGRQQACLCERAHPAHRCVARAVDLQIAVRLPAAQHREDAAQNLVAASRDALSEPSSMARTASARCAAPCDLAQDAPQVAVPLAPAGPLADRLAVPGHTPTHRASRRAVPNRLLATRAERSLTELVAARKQVESCLEHARRQIHQIDRRVLRRESPGGGECVLAVRAAHAVVREGQGGGSRGTGGTAERVGVRAVVRAVLAGDVERGGRGRGVPADGSDAGAVSALGGLPLRTGLSLANRPRPDEMLEFNALPPKGRLPEAGRDGERVKWERAKRKQAALRLAT